MTDKIYDVLFLCTGNSARSILAEAILNRLGAGRFRAHSAGSRPVGAVHPHALKLLHSLNYPVEGVRSKSWDEFSCRTAPTFDFVFTVCDSAANDTCPVWPGQPLTAHWGVADPAALACTEAEQHLAFRETYRMLNHRIDIFVNLPIASLERMTLQRRLGEIGRALPEDA